MNMGQHGERSDNTSPQGKNQRVPQSPGGVVELVQATFVELTTEERTQAIQALTALLAAYHKQP